MNFLHFLVERSLPRSLEDILSCHLCQPPACTPVLLAASQADLHKWPAAVISTLALLGSISCKHGKASGAGFLAEKA